MKINLYYVEGISRIDTPSFNTKNYHGNIQDQDNYFLTKLVKSIDSTFYPPHYRNTIKFDSSDLVITDNINYLSLEYNDKKYYYFIDKIDYTSTGIITLAISMDVIQTYMFNIRISSGIIQRKFINRWTGTNYLNINRNYIRENLSNGNFANYIDKQYLNDDSRYWLMIGVFTKFSKGSTLENLIPGATVQNLDNNVDDENIIMTAPYAIKIATLQPFDVTDSEHNTHNLNGIHFSKSAAYIAETRDVFICPFNCFPNSLTFDFSNLKVNLHDYRYNNWLIGYLNFNDMHGETVNYIASVGNLYSTETINQEVTWNFTRNTAVGVAFSSNYVPALLDENYIRLTFGSNSANTTFPLYQLKRNSVYCRYAFNLLNGTRIYYISPDIITNVDRYDTMVIDTNILSIDLKNDAWAQYISSNKNRWSMLINSATTGALATMVKMDGKGGYATADMNAKTGVSIVNSVGSLVNQIYTEGNLLHTPPTVKQTGSFSTGALGKSALIYYKTELVNDYTQCAQYYHRNGYLVNEYVTQITDIFLYVRNRYYYDMLKMNVPEVHLSYIIEDENTISEIKSRLENGVRLWNVKNNIVIGDFYYDNVEYDYLS